MIKKLISILSLLVLIVWNHAQAGFFSLHQLPLTISQPFNNTTQTYPQYSAVGFRDQYNPEHSVTGCQIGALNNNACAFPSQGVFSFPSTLPYYSFTQPEFKIYLPAGTKTIRLIGYYAQNVQGAFAVRFRQQPTKTTLSESYQDVVRRMEWNNGFSRLINGEELVVAHEGGGTLNFPTGYLQNSNNGISQGGWLYFRLIHGSFPAALNGGLEVDIDTYKNAYRQIQWDANNDPVESNTSSGGTGSTGNTSGTGSTGSTGGSTPSFTISVSPTAWKSGDTVTVTASGAELQSCSYQNGLNTVNFQLSNDKKTATAIAPQVPNRTTLNITCLSAGLATASVSITVDPAALQITGTPRYDTTGKASLTLNVTVPAEDVGKKATIYVVAVAKNFISGQDNYFVLTTENGRTWKELPNNPFADVPSTKLIPQLERTFNLQALNNEINKFWLTLFKVRIFLAYQLEENPSTIRVSNELRAYWITQN